MQWDGEPIPTVLWARVGREWENVALITTHVLVADQWERPDNISRRVGRRAREGRGQCDVGSGAGVVGPSNADSSARGYSIRPGHRPVRVPVRGEGPGGSISSPLRSRRTGNTH
jgi:hypothetical protein